MMTVETTTPKTQQRAEPRKKKGVELLDNAVIKDK